MFNYSLFLVQLNISFDEMEISGDQDRQFPSPFLEVAKSYEAMLHLC
jgi:hypothetical protein